MPSPLTAELMLHRASVREQALCAMPGRELRALDGDFRQWAHAGQAAPEGEWRTWVLMAGRGFGKTRAGAEWVWSLVRGEGSKEAVGGGSGWPGAGRARTPHPARALRESPSPSRREGLRIALVAASLDEARRVMVEGPSGILALAREGEVEEWSFSRRTILFAGGAEATLFSGAHPEGLRGPEHDFAWCDELAKWRQAAETWSNLQLGLRRGTFPRSLVTTTPWRVAALRGVLGEEGVAVTGGRSRDNPHVPDAWLGAMERMHGGTTHGRQEIGGELLDEVEGALWPRALIEGARVQAHADSSGKQRGLIRIVIGVDPPAGDTGAACGIVAAGLGHDGVGYVIGDHSVAGLSPEGWAKKVAAAAETWGAAGDVRVVAEANNGGKMVESVLRGAGVAVPVRLVHAAEGKVARAAPVAALFEGGRAKFAGAFPELEDELAGLSWGGGVGTGGGRGGGRSPDRADAMVWALTALMLGRGMGEPALRFP